MASNPTGKTGKWVERAATTGGGRTYRGQRPVNWYASLALICIVGLLLVGYSRYERTHQTASSAGPPTTQQTWFAALGIDVCGKLQPNLPASTNTSKTGLVADGNGVLTIAPKNSSESGGNATLGKFVSGYPGLQLSQTTLQYPGKQAYTNGDVCPKGTPDAGKPGVVLAVSWPNFTSKGPGTETSGPPEDLKFANGQLITMAFIPATATVPKPLASAITSLITAVTQGTTTTPTTVVPTTPTTVVPTTPTTVAPTTPTTAQKSGGSTK
ncbi:MAG: hypothetical protein ACLQPH_01740 [Acidimicrobiales bacterium]